MPRRLLPPHRDLPVGSRTEIVAALQHRYDLIARLPGMFPGVVRASRQLHVGVLHHLHVPVIAKDMFSAFDRADLLAPDVAARYRGCIPRPGGSGDAADLVRISSAVPYSFDTFGAWLAT